MDSICSWLILNLVCLLIRFGDDVYDRIWLPDNNYKGIVTSHTIDSQSHNEYQPPSVVMSSAATPGNDSSPLDYYWEAENATSEYQIYMHFAEVVDLKANQSRSFNITINGNHFFGPVLPPYLSTYTVYSKSVLNIAQTYKVSIFKTESSTLPPILNAVEIYSVRDFPYSETDQQDRMFSSYLSFFLFVSSFVLIWMHMKILVDAITTIKSTYGVKRNWQGDPCVPQAYSWKGLNCSYDDYNPPRIISL